jgi:hypothetical protein
LSFTSVFLLLPILSYPILASNGWIPVQLLDVDLGLLPLSHLSTALVRNIFIKAAIFIISDLVEFTFPTFADFQV